MKWVLCLRVEEKRGGAKRCRDRCQRSGVQLVSKKGQQAPRTPDHDPGAAAWIAINDAAVHRHLIANPGYMTIDVGVDTRYVMPHPIKPLTNTLAPRRDLPQRNTSSGGFARGPPRDGYTHAEHHLSSSHPTRSNAIHSLLALFTSILHACCASVFLNSFFPFPPPHVPR